MDSLDQIKYIAYNLRAIPDPSSGTYRVFDSVNMPFVLRQDGRQYRIAGSCYIEGLVNGEAVIENSKWVETHVIYNHGAPSTGTRSHLHVSSCG